MRYVAIALIALVAIIALLPTIASALPGSFASTYRRLSAEALRRAAAAPTPLVTEADLGPLPGPVARYVRYTGAVGKPRVVNFHAVMGGAMSREQGGKWLPITAEQYNFYDQPSRLFFMKSSLFGIPFIGLHVFQGDSATMQISVASLVQVVDAKGDKMNQGETVTMFNDMCFLAPATLIDPRIAWEPIDDRSARAHFTNNGITITAVLRFNDADELIDFYSDDRFMSSDGKTYENYRWSTPISSYRTFGDRRIASKGVAMWHTPTGEYPYIRFDIHDVAYNVPAQ